MRHASTMSSDSPDWLTFVLAGVGGAYAPPPTDRPSPFGHSRAERLAKAPCFLGPFFSDAWISRPCACSAASRRCMGTYPLFVKTPAVLDAKVPGRGCSC